MAQLDAEFEHGCQVGSSILELANFIFASGEQRGGLPSLGKHEKEGIDCWLGLGRLSWARQMGLHLAR